MKKYVSQCNGVVHPCAFNSFWTTIDVWTYVATLDNRINCCFLCDLLTARKKIGFVFKAIAVVVIRHTAVMLRSIQCPHK